MLKPHTPAIYWILKTSTCGEEAAGESNTSIQLSMLTTCPISKLSNKLAMLDCYAMTDVSVKPVLIKNNRILPLEALTPDFSLTMTRLLTEYRLAHPR